MLQSVKLKKQENMYNSMNVQEESKLVKNLEGYLKLRKTPDEITDISLLERAIALLEVATEVTGREYVFKEIQQLSIGGYMDLLPKDYEIKSKVNWVIATYDKSYFENRIRE